MYVVRLLLARKEIQFNQCTNQNTTPTNSASDSGHTDIVKLLLAQPNIDINKQDNWGDTPESRASKKGQLQLWRFFKITMKTTDMCKLIRGDLGTFDGVFQVHVPVLIQKKTS